MLFFVIVDFFVFKSYLPVATVEIVSAPGGQVVLKFQNPIHAKPVIHSFIWGEYVFLTLMRSFQIHHF